MEKMLFCMGACLISGSLAAKEEKLPNILLILVDDAGYADFGFTGHTDFRTPNIDRLVANGMRFTDMHVSGSISGPSRSGLITGRYQQRFGNETNASVDLGVPLSEKMLPKVLKTNGYKTAVFGKWHLGLDEEYHPMRRGFDEFYGFLGGGREYFYNPKDKDDIRLGIQHNGEYVAFDGYLTDVLGQKTVEFIENNKNNPFFIYLSYNAVHTPFQATPEDLALFAGSPRQTLAAMTWALDRSVGNVIEKLEKERLIDNTLIVFMSDNGGDVENTKINAPLKAGKGTEFEGGHRIISVMQWNGVLPKKSQFSGLCSSLDLFPTFLKAAGIAKTTGKPLDGVDLMPYLTGEKRGNPHEWLFWHLDRWSAVRYNDYKLIYADGVGDRLYDMSDNPDETVDIRAQNPGLYDMMMGRLAQWRNEMVPSLSPGEGIWTQVKEYLYEDLLNNQPVRYRKPADLKGTGKYTN